MSRKNIAHSIRQRLLNLSQESGEEFQSILIRYVIERCLNRLCNSQYSSRFILKGASLFACWTGQIHRPTRDLDLLGFGDPSPQYLQEIFRTIFAIESEDGLVFQPDSVFVEAIREDQMYGGQRIKTQVHLGRARIDLQIDIGFGDVITPGPEITVYPSLLGTSSFQVRTYPRETVVAEKLEAIAKLGLANSRMKDFYDLIILSRKFEFAGTILRKAIIATFSKRDTPLPSVAPVGLRNEFAQDTSKQTQWNAFRLRTRLHSDVGDLATVITELSLFLVPVLAASTTTDFPFSWVPAGPWKAS